MMKHQLLAMFEQGARIQGAVYYPRFAGVLSLNMLYRSFADSSQGRSAVTSMKESANKEMDSAKDSMNEMPDKVKQTAEELMEVGKEAAKALKRDTERLAEVVGIKEKKPGDLDRTEF
ncbi:unnamed protein product [Sphagnum compactum]